MCEFSTSLLCSGPNHVYCMSLHYSAWQKHWLGEPCLFDSITLNDSIQNQMIKFDPSQYKYIHTTRHIMWPLENTRRSKSNWKFKARIFFLILIFLLTKIVRSDCSILWQQQDACIYMENYQPFFILINVNNAVRLLAYLSSLTHTYPFQLKLVSFSLLCKEVPESGNHMVRWAERNKQNISTCILFYGFEVSSLSNIYEN